MTRQGLALAALCVLAAAAETLAVTVGLTRRRFVRALNREAARLGPRIVRGKGKGEGEGA